MQTIIKSTDKNIWLSSPGSSHLVEFYNYDDDLVDNIYEFISSGLRRDEVCIIIASAAHLLKIKSKLSRGGFDVAKFQKNNQLILLDTAETLEKFMTNNLPDEKKFASIVGELIKNLVKNGKPIRAYGEMVALLWKVGNKDAVMKLEELWNELGSKHSFSLYCAYPALHFISDSASMHEVSSHHSLHLQTAQM